MTDLATDWAAAGETELAGIVELRRAIHADPEIGNHCPRTAAKLRVALAGRTHSPRTREKAREGMARIVESAAAAHGLTAELRIDDGYPVTMNAPRAVALLGKISEAIEAGRWWQMRAPLMGGEDFGYVLREEPGAMAFLGVAPHGSDPATNPPLHNAKMMVEETAMAKGIALRCAYAERFLDRGFD